MRGYVYVKTRMLAYALPRQGPSVATEDKWLVKEVSKTFIGQRCANFQAPNNSWMENPTDKDRLLLKHQL